MKYKNLGGILHIALINIPWTCKALANPALHLASATTHFSTVMMRINIVNGWGCPNRQEG